MSSAPYNLVLLPEVDLAAKAVKISQSLEPLVTRFTLGEAVNLPHLSIYMLQLADEDISHAGKFMADIAHDTPPIRLEATEYVQNERYLDASYERTKDIEALQRAVLKTVGHLRHGLRDSTKAHLRQTKGLALQNIKEYGDWRIGKLFRPHLTLTRFVQLTPLVLEDLPAPSYFSGTYTTLALCSMGEDGTCIQKVVEYPLA